MLSLFCLRVDNFLAHSDSHSSSSIWRRFGSAAPAIRQTFALPVSIDPPDRRIDIAERLRFELRGWFEGFALKLSPAQL
jgi:hypothetical protein